MSECGVLYLYAMLQALTLAIKPRKPVWGEPKGLRSEPRKLVAHILDARQEPLERGPKPWQILLFGILPNKKGFGRRSHKSARKFSRRGPNPGGRRQPWA